MEYNLCEHCFKVYETGWKDKEREMRNAVYYTTKAGFTFLVDHPLTLFKTGLLVNAAIKGRIV